MVPDPVGFEYLPELREYAILVTVWSWRHLYIGFAFTRVPLRLRQRYHNHRLFVRGFHLSFSFVDLRSHLARLSCEAQSTQEAEGCS